MITCRACDAAAVGEGADWLLRLFPAAGPEAVCLIVPSGDAGAFADESAEMQRYAQLAREMQDQRYATMIVEMPERGDRSFSCRAEEIRARHHRILGMFSYAAREFPELPLLLVAAGDNAPCATALLRAERPETARISDVLLVGHAASVTSGGWSKKRVSVLSGPDTLPAAVRAALTDALKTPDSASPPADSLAESPDSPPRRCRARP